MQYIENRTYDELEVGDSAEITRTLRKEDIELFAVLSGDVNPAHVDDDFARSDAFHKVIAHGMWGGALISAVLGTELPGPGTIYLDQTLHFRKPGRHRRHGHRARDACARRHAGQPRHARLPVPQSGRRSRRRGRGAACSRRP